MSQPTTTQAEAMVAAKTALKKLLKDSTEPALKGVQIAWNHPGAKIESSTVIIGNSRREDQTPAALGNRQRDARWRIELVVDVLSRKDAEDTAAAGVAIAAAVEREVQRNPELGIPAAGIVFAQVSNMDLLELVRDNRHEVEIPIDVSVFARFSTRT